MPLASKFYLVNFANSGKDEDTRSLYTTYWSPYQSQIWTPEPILTTFEGIPTYFKVYFRH